MTDENTTNEAKLYELGFHVNPAINDDQISKKIDEIKAVLTKNGAEIVKEGEPQAMKLAYEITKSIAGKNERFTTSTFAWIKFNSTAEGIESIKEEIDANDEIIRSIIIKTTDDDEHSTSKITNEDKSEEDDSEGEGSEEEKAPETVEVSEQDDSEEDTEEAPADDSEDDK